MACVFGITNTRTTRVSRIPESGILDTRSKDQAMRYRDLLDKLSKLPHEEQQHIALIKDRQGNIFPVDSLQVYDQYDTASDKFVVIVI